jgi:hypothetical protein
MRFHLSIQSDLDEPLIQHFRLTAELDESDFEFFDGLSNLQLQNGQLGSISGVRYTDGFFDPRETNDTLAIDMDDRDGDLGEIMSHMQICQSQIERLFGSVIDNDVMPIGLIILNRVEVNPIARGQKLALVMMEALQRLHIRTPYMVALNAVPIEIEDSNPEFDPLQRRLLRYYTSCPHLGLRQVAPKTAPEFVMGYWSGDNAVPMPILDLTYISGVTERTLTGVTK